MFIITWCGYNTLANCFAKRFSIETKPLHRLLSKQEQILVQSHRNKLRALYTNLRITFSSSLTQFLNEYLIVWKVFMLNKKTWKKGFQTFHNNNLNVVLLTRSKLSMLKRKKTWTLSCSIEKSLISFHIRVLQWVQNMSQY